MSDNTNYFQLHADSSPSLLIADGTDITPITDLAHKLLAHGRRFQLHFKLDTKHYASLSLNQMISLKELEDKFSSQLFLYPLDQEKNLNVSELLEAVPANTNIYVYGSKELITDVETTAILLGFSREKFHAASIKAGIKDEKEEADQDLILELARSHKTIAVKKDQSLLSALRDANINVHYDCCIGECGTCAVKILEGEADHRDHVLSDDLKKKGFICVCVSRAKSGKLVLDL